MQTVTWCLGARTCGLDDFPVARFAPDSVCLAATVERLSGGTASSFTAMISRKCAKPARGCWTQLQRGDELLRDITRTLARWQLEPADVEFDVTEAALAPAEAPT